MRRQNNVCTAARWALHLYFSLLAPRTPRAGGHLSDLARCWPYAEGRRPVSPRGASSTYGAHGGASHAADRAHGGAARLRGRRRRGRAAACRRNGHPCAGTRGLVCSTVPAPRARQRARRQRGPQDMATNSALSMGGAAAAWQRSPWPSCALSLPTPRGLQAAAVAGPRCHPASAAAALLLGLARRRTTARAAHLSSRRLRARAALFSYAGAIFLRCAAPRASCTCPHPGMYRQQATNRKRAAVISCRPAAREHFLSAAAGARTVHLLATRALLCASWRLSDGALILPCTLEHHLFMRAVIMSK